MSIDYVVRDNYVDFFSSHPFVIRGCLEVGPWRRRSLQPLPLRARPGVEAGAVRYFATLWALDPGSVYFFTAGPVAGDGRAPDENAAEGHNAANPPDCIEGDWFPVTMPQKKGILRDWGAFFIFDEEILYRDDFLDCVLAQKNDHMFIKQPVGPHRSLLHRLFYHALFSVPIDLFGAATYALPNPEAVRCCIDFQQENISWRGSRKTRRIISSDCFAVVVNRDIRDSLHLAMEYHSKQNKTTWLNPTLIDCLVDMAEHPEFGVQIMAVELVKKSSESILAGCLGFALGAVYHDFTMFTVERSSEGFGNVITKILGEALHMCGYNLWYWGPPINYMHQFEKKYGMRNFSRAEFFARWRKYREEQPLKSIKQFFQFGEGMIPYWDPLN